MNISEELFQIAHKLETLASQIKLNTPTQKHRITTACSMIQNAATEEKMWELSPFKYTLGTYFPSEKAGKLKDIDCYTENVQGDHTSYTQTIPSRGHHFKFVICKIEHEETDWKIVIYHEGRSILKTKSIYSSPEDAAAHSNDILEQLAEQFYMEDV